MNAWTSGYSIGKSQMICSHTGRALRVGEQLISALVEDPQRQQIERRNFSLDGWAQARAAGDIADRALLGFWKGHVHQPGEKPKPILDDEAMLDLFGQTEGSSASRANLRLVLALMMIRRRLLVHDGNRGSTMLVRPRGVPRPPDGPALLEVPDPGISEAAIAEVIAELESLGMDDAAGPDPVTIVSTGTAK